MSVCRCLALLVSIALLAPSLGCLGGGKVEPIPQVSASSAASGAIEQYDSNGDGQLAGDELASCPALTLQKFDSNSDKAISQEELESRFNSIFSTGAAMANVTATVVDGRRPLAGVTVSFEPESFMGDALHSASGVTDGSGTASIAIAADDLPEAQRGSPMCQVGVYRVKLSGGDIPGTLPDTGFIVDITSREGLAATFDISKMR